MKGKCIAFLSVFLLFGMAVLPNVDRNRADAASITIDISSEQEESDPKQEESKKQNLKEKPVRVIKKKGVYYAVKKDKTVYMPQKEEMREIGKYTYYVRKNGELAQGPVKINGKSYYFNEKARLQGDIRPLEAKGKYYNVNEKGIMNRISKKQAKAELAAQNFIAMHTEKSSSDSEKFRTCFYYMLRNMRYSPNYFKMREDYKIIDQKDGGYTLALQMFESPVFRGNCHRFANCVAAVAKELGYHPTVIVTTGDHSFVKIDGKYYDNMGALFGASSRKASYTVYKKIKYT